MEGKLYLNSEPSGNKKEGKKRKEHKYLKLFLFVLFILVSIMSIIWLLKGSKTTYGQYPENVKNESISCIATSLIPPKLDSIDSEIKEIKINAIFNGTEEIKRIYFTYTLKYNDENEAYGNEAKSHAFLNKSLVASGYPVDKFDNKFSRYNSDLSISLTAEKRDLDEYSAPYFMLLAPETGELGDGNMIWFKGNYEKQGFTCESSIN